MITVLLLNWKRQQNMVRIIHALGQQTLKPKVFLWNNQANDFNVPFVSPVVEWQVNSTENKGCGVRWWMAQFADTPYVMTLDDDLLPGPGLCAAVVAEHIRTYAASHGDRLIIGAFGKHLEQGVAYEQCPAAEYDQHCRLVLGRCMSMPTSMIKGSRLAYSDPLMFMADDIAVCGLWAGILPQPACYVSQSIASHLTELPDDHALCRQEGHFERREQARKKWIG